MSERLGLTETLEAIKDDTEGKEISFEDLVSSLNHRGFGTLLIGPALITILPTGAIPGIPALCGLFIALIATQIVMGRSYPWLPEKLKNIAFSREKYIDTIQKYEPYTERIDEFFHPRFEFLTREVAQRIIAAFCVILSLGMVGIGFIPFVPALLALPILLFGLGLSVHDGLLTAFGFVLMLAAGAVIPYLFD